MLRKQKVRKREDGKDTTFRFGDLELGSERLQRHLERAMEKKDAAGSSAIGE